MPVAQVSGPASARTARSGGAGRRILIGCVLVALAVASVRGLLVQSMVIPSGSMQPTLEPGDRVLVSRSAYRLGQVRRGDVVVFDGTGVFDPGPAPPTSALARAGRDFAAAMGVPLDERDYVKRVIGLPGERVACCDGRGRVTVDGQPLAEPYVHPGDAPSEVRFDTVVPRGRVWVMGDHRSASADSRAHQGGPGGGSVPMSRIVGRVVAVYWPLGRAGVPDRAGAIALRGVS